MTKPVIVTRASKGSALTWTEGDSNFTNLQNATLSVTDGTNTKALNLNDTLTFTAGTNVTLSVNASTGAVTVNSSNPGGTVTSVTSTTLTVAGTSAIPTVNLTSGIATAGTYQSVTVDTYGRVTAGTTITQFNPASPGAIGGTTPAAITGTTITANTGSKLAQDILNEQRIHISETAWVGTEFDRVVDNNGTIDQLYAQVKRLVQVEPEPTSSGFYKPLADSLNI